MWYAIQYDLRGLTVLCDMWLCDGLCVIPYMLAVILWFCEVHEVINLGECVFYNTYMSKNVTCSLTQLRTCGQVLSDITPHASTLLSGPGYQDGGRSAWDTLLIGRRSLMYYVAVWYRDLKTLIPNTCYLWV